MKPHRRDCTFGEPPLESGQKIVVNPEANCRCMLPVGTEAFTWGRVKALYCE